MKKINWIPLATLVLIGGISLVFLCLGNHDDQNISENTATSTILASLVEQAPKTTETHPDRYTPQETLSLTPSLSPTRTQTPTTTPTATTSPSPTLTSSLTPTATLLPTWTPITPTKEATKKTPLDDVDPIFPPPGLDS